MKNENKRPTVEQLNDVITVNELAAFIGVTPRMIMNMISRDEIKSFKFGKCRLFLKQDVLEMIGYSAELDRKQKSITIVSEENEEFTQPEVKMVPIPRARTHGYDSMSMGG